MHSVQQAHLYLKDEALPGAIISRRYPPALACEAAKDMLLCIPHDQH